MGADPCTFKMINLGSTNLMLMSVVIAGIYKVRVHVYLVCCTCVHHYSGEDVQCSLAKPQTDSQTHFRITYNIKYIVTRNDIIPTCPKWYLEWEPKVYLVSVMYQIK